MNFGKYAGVPAITYSPNSCSYTYEHPKSLNTHPFSLTYIMLDGLISRCAILFKCSTNNAVKI